MFTLLLPHERLRVRLATALNRVCGTFQVGHSKPHLLFIGISNTRRCGQKQRAVSLLEDNASGGITWLRIHDSGGRQC